MRTSCPRISAALFIVELICFARQVELWPLRRTQPRTWCGHSVALNVFSHPSHGMTSPISAGPGHTIPSRNWRAVANWSGRQRSESSETRNHIAAPFFLLAWRNDATQRSGVCAARQGDGSCKTPVRMSVNGAPTAAKFSCITRHASPCRSRIVDSTSRRRWRR